MSLQKPSWAFDAIGLKSHKRKDRSEADQNQLEEIMKWVSERLEEGESPRVSDVVEYAHQVLGWTHLKKSQIAAKLRLHPSFIFNSAQQRQKFRSRKYRPIATNTLGLLHCDIGYFGLSRNYETPVTYRAGFLAAKDVLSRFTYAVILRKSKSAKALIAALSTLLEKHKAQFNHNIKSVSFDREPGIMSSDVQEFFRTNNISFHPFKYSVSKAKHSENAIRLIRTAMTRQLRAHPGKRWWQLLDQVVASLNSRKIRINHKTLRWAPKDINQETLPAFLQTLKKTAPSHYWAQFALAPDLVQFKYAIGTLVRPKLIVTSSAVLGVKHSERNLEEDIFIVTEHIAYVSAAYTVGRAYRCELIKQPSHFEIFDESDLAETTQEPST